jgi:hypothetical protein
MVKLVEQLRLAKRSKQMTKEPIMIDDVDVSGCHHLIDDYQWWNIAGQEEHDINRCALSFDKYRDFEEDDFCKENPNCYFKQLKRKEQECEELKDLADHNGRVCNERLDKIDELEHNINKLMQQLDQLKAEIRNRNEKIEELRFSVSDLTNRLCNLNAEKSFRIVDYLFYCASLGKIERAENFSEFFLALTST